MPGQRGGALVMGVLLVCLFITLTGALVSYAIVRGASAEQRAVIERQVRAVDAATAVKISRLVRFDDRSLVGTFADGTRYAAIVRPAPQGDLFKLTVAALAPRSRAPAVVEVVVERQIATAQSSFKAAIMAKQTVEVSGNSTVSGNNHGLDEQPVGLGPGPTSLHDQVAILSKQGVILANNAVTLIGCGATPSNQLHNVYAGADASFPTVDGGQNAMPDAGLWGNSATDHFPTTPEQVLNSPDGLAKERARGAGTYFTSEAEYQAWAAALPAGRVPPNQLLYLDFRAPSPGLDLGSLDWGTTYHTVVNHHPITAECIRPRLGIAGATPTAYVDRDQDGAPDMLATGATGSPVYDGYGWVKTEPDGDSVLKSPHTTFFGVLIVDDMSNMNAQTRIFGGVCSLQNDNGSAHSLCNGGATIKYSAAAVDRAIARNLYTGVAYRVLSYRERPRTRDAEAAWREVGAATTIANPDDAVSATDAARTADGWFEPRSATVSATALD